MITPIDYRLRVRDAAGNYRFTVLRDSSFNLGSKGMRMSLTPEMGCNEWTMVSRNGPVNGTGGMGLNPLDLVTFAVTGDNSTWTTLFFGELRQGGNRYDTDGESMILRGLDVRLRETPTLDASYAQMDGGALTRQLVISTLGSGLLGQVIFPSLTIPPAPNGPTDTRIILYDASLMPDLGFSVTLTATNQQPLGVLLDSIVTAGASQGHILRWGVRPDGYVFMLPVRTDELNWTAEHVIWKEPQSDVVVTGVMWDIEQRLDTGKILRHRSDGPDLVKYGARTKPLTFPPDLNPWKPLSVIPVYTGTTSTTPAGLDTTLTIRDRDLTSSVTVSRTSGTSSVDLTVPAGGAKRLYVDATGTSGGVLSILMSFPGSGTFLQPTSDPNNQTFAQMRSYEEQYRVFSTNPTSGLPAGTVITLQIASVGTAGSSMVVREFRLELLDTVTLDAAASAYYRTPETAPADLTKQGVLLPVDLRGKVRMPRPTGADYTANVSLYEYSLSSAGGAQTTVKTGDPDAPEQTARNTLTQRLAGQATANAVQASTVFNETPIPTGPLMKVFS